MGENRFKNTEPLEVPEPVVTVESPREEAADVSHDGTSESKVDKSKKNGKKKNRKGVHIINVLGGDFLAREQLARQIPFMIYVTVLLMAIITNTYIAEKRNREIMQNSRQLNDMQVEYIQLKSAIMEASKQSVLSRKLAGSGLKEAVEPLKRINVPDDTERKEEK